jgi:hypothetical protein
MSHANTCLLSLEHFQVDAAQHPGLGHDLLDRVEDPVPAVIRRQTPPPSRPNGGISAL